MQVNHRTIKEAIGISAKDFAARAGWEIDEGRCKNRYGLNHGCASGGGSCTMCRGEIDEEIVAVRAKKGYGGEYHFLTKSGAWIRYWPGMKFFIGVRSTKKEAEKWFKI